MREGFKEGDESLSLPRVCNVTQHPLNQRWSTKPVRGSVPRGEKLPSLSSGSLVCSARPFSSSITTTATGRGGGASKRAETGKGEKWRTRETPTVSLMQPGKRAGARERERENLPWDVGGVAGKALPFEPVRTKFHHLTRPGSELSQSS